MSGKRGKQERPLLVLLDGHGIIHRAYHAMKEPLTVRRTGEVVSAVYGFANTLLSVLEELKPTHIAVALDPPGPTFRHIRDETYKAHRPEAPEELVSQFGRVREVIDAFNIPVYMVEGYEADDVLGSLARQASEQGVDTFLVTLDSDIVQLVCPGVRVFMLRPYQRDTVIYDEEAARERYGVEPSQMADLKGLKGDVSDNIPGVPGIGDKTAVKLVQQFDSVENIYEHLEEVEPEKLREKLREHEEQARRSKEMVIIDSQAPATLELEKCRLHDYDQQRVLDLFRELEFRSLVSRLPEPLAAEGEEKPAAPEVEEAGANYQAVFTEDELKAVAARIAEKKSVAFDTETTDVNAMRARLVGLAVSTEPGWAAYIPVGHQPALDEQQLSLSTVLRHLGPLLEDPAIEKVAHNGKYDMTVLAQAGVDVRNLDFDTMIAAHVLGEGGGSESYGAGGGSLSLKWLASKRLGIEMTRISELIGTGAKQISMAQVPVERAAPYACADADMTGRLRSLLEGELREQGLWPLFSEIEMPLVPVLMRMELAGAALDEKPLRKMSQELGAQIDELEKRIYDEIGHEFNVNSPQQLSQVLFEELGLPKGLSRRTKTGHYSTDALVLEKARGLHPVIDLLLDYRELTKLKFTYVDVLPGLVNPGTNRVHTTFNQTVTATGRLSSEEPNLQNIPVRSELGDQIRCAFVARDFGPDPRLLAADYSQIELRILAHLCQDPGLLEAFGRDEDIHAATASQVFDVPLSGVTPEMRRRAKVFNFGVLYGLSEFGLSQREGISREEAAKFIETYFAKYPRVKGWRDETVASCREKGYAETMVGRRRYIPEIRSPNAQVRAAAERMAINMPIQGTASDIIKIAMNRIDAEMRERKMATRMTLQVHDELIFEGPASELDDPSAGSGHGVREMVERIMPLRSAQGRLQSLALDVPLKVDIKVGRNWGELE